MDIGIRHTTDKIKGFILKMNKEKDTEVKKKALEYIIIELNMIEEEVKGIISD